MDNQKLTYARLLELNREQKNEIEFLKARLAILDTQYTSPEIVGESRTGNYERLLLAAKAAGLGYFEWFPKTNHIEWDPVMHDIFGLEPDSKLEKNQYFYDIIHPDDKDRVSKDTNASLDVNCKKLYFPTEYKVVLPGGLLKYIQAYSLHFRNQAGEVIRIIGTCQDISLQRKSQYMARESELRYSALVETINSGVATYKVINQGKSGDDYIIQDFNKTALEHEGLKKEEVIGKSLKNLRPKIDEYGLIPILQKVWQTGEPAYYPAKVYTDGKFYNYYENRVYRLPNKEIVAIYDDVTDKRLTEIALEESEEKYRLLADHATDVIWVMDLKTNRFEYISPSVFQLRGLSQEEALHESLAETLTPESRARIEKIVPQRLKSYLDDDANDDFYIDELQQYKKDGSVFWVETSTRFQQKPNGDIQVIGISRNIDGRKKAQEKIKFSEEKFRLLLHNQTDLIVKVDKENRFLFVSPKYCETFGKTEDELIGSTFMPLVHKDDREATKKAMDTLFHPPYTCTIEQRALTVDGWLWFEWVDKAVLDENGVVKEIIGVGRDITERKNAERKMLEINEELAAQNEEYLVLNEELSGSMERIKTINTELALAKDKAQESDRLKSAFLANMSHEIRTPMNGILGFADLLKTPNLTGQQQQKYVGVIEKSGERMLNIINDLIDISKIGAGQVEVVISAVNISDQVEYLYTFFMPEAEKKGLQISFVNPLKGGEAIIKTDKEKMFAILTNLIKNAVKYTPSGSINFGYELRQIEGKPFLQFRVKDTGIGVQADRQQAIFERFVQADIEDKQVYEGAGLGLAISKAYVEMLGGKIWVESREGSGSEFYFTIPYTPFKAKKNTFTKPTLEEKSPPGSKKLNVLVVEDDDTSILHLSIILQKIAKDVAFSKTGSEAIKHYKKNTDTDLILMDIKMPGMDGYETTREIRKLNKKVVIIAQTAYALTGDREKALQSGCNDYITKPINKGDLYRVIREHF